MKTAAIYARVSTDEQAAKGYSLPSQLEACRKYAEAHGFTVIEELADDCSGTIPIADRPKGRKLYELAGNNKVNAVIIYTHDRTARDERVIEYLLFKSYLHDRGIELHYSDTGLDPYTMEGNLVGYIKAHAAAEERQKIRERSMRGTRAKAKAGYYIKRAAPPYGYKHGDKDGHVVLVIEENESKIVRLIYIWYVEGDESGYPLSLFGITKKLIAMGVPSPGVSRHSPRKKSHAAHWYSSTVGNILRSEVYTGVWHYNVHERNGHDPCKVRPREEWIPVSVPAIVDRELWEQAQKRLRAHPKTPSDRR